MDEKLLRELGRCPWATTTIGEHYDQESIAWAEVRLRKVKHVELKYHWTQFLIATGQITVKYVASNENVADIMSKMLGYTRLEAVKESL